MKVGQFFVLAAIILSANTQDMKDLQTLMDMILARIGGGYMYDKTRPSIEERSEIRNLVGDFKEAKERRKLLYLDRNQVLQEIHELINECQDALESAQTSILNKNMSLYGVIAGSVKKFKKQ